MAGESTIQDYDIIDSFLSKSLESYNKQLFGEYDDNTGYFKEIQNDENDSQVSEEDTEPEQEDNQDEPEEDIYNSMFDEGPGTNNFVQGVKGGAAGFKSFDSYEEGKTALVNQLKLYQTGKTRNNVTPDSTLLEAMSVYAPAADKNNPTAYAKFVAKKLGVDINTPISQLDTKKWADAIEQMEGNKTGNNPGNLRRQEGGNVANTVEQQYYGLNDESLDNLLLPLQGTNIIRGLDNGEPVHVQDEFGNSNILYGPEDTISLKGPVYEKRINKKYKTK